MLLVLKMKFMPIRIKVKIYVLCVKNFGKKLIFHKVTVTLNF